MGGVGCICGPQSGLGVEVMSNVGQVAFDFVRSHATYRQQAWYRREHAT